MIKKKGFQKGYGLGRTYAHEPENNLREFRVERGLTQTELMRRAGLSKSFSYLSRVEMGHTGFLNPQTGKPQPWLEKVCEFLDKSPSEVFPREMCDIERGNFTDDQLIELTMGQSADQEDFSSLYHVLELLPERLKGILFMRYYGGLSLEGIAAELGVTRERIRQLQTQALRKLRHPSLKRFWR